MNKKGQKDGEPKFKITSSQRKLLKEYNPEGLPDFRTKEFKKLSYDEKENYILEQLAIAIENRKELKKVNNIIGDVKYEIIQYDMKTTFNNIYDKLKIQYPNYNDVELSKIAERDLEYTQEEIIKYEQKKGNILLRDLESNFFDELTDILRKQNQESDEPEDNPFTTDSYLFELENYYDFKIKENELNKTSFKDGYKDFHYFNTTNIINYEMKVKINNIDDYIKALILIFEYTHSFNIVGDSANDSGEIKYKFLKPNYKINYNINNKNIDKLHEIKMREASVYNLEDYDNQEWDTKKGRCVFDYIINRYGNLKGLKLACNDEELIKIFGDDDTLINGVNTFQIEKFCRNFNIPLYAYDEDENLFHYYYPDKVNKNYPSMMFKIQNNHFYPIPDKKRKALINKKVGLNIYSNLYQDNKHNEENNKQYELLHLDNGENPIQILGEMMNDNKKIPLINMYNGKITSIKLNDMRYLFTEENKEIKEIVEKMGLEYKGQSVQQLTNLIIKDKIKTSSPNINVYNDLLQAKKNRSFNGLVKDIKKEFKKNKNHYYKYNFYDKIYDYIFLDNKIEESEKTIYINNLNYELQEIQKIDAIKYDYYYNNDFEEFNKDNNLIAYDINKCYSSVMYDPLEDWILLDINNEWEDFNGDLKLGLYYIETDDNLLFKGNNIYSLAIVKKAIEEKINFKIIKVIYANKTQDKKLFTDIINDILKITDNKPKLYKILINSISGIMGKHKMTYTKANINKSIRHIYITLDNYKNNDKEILPFITKIDNTDYYIYGYNKDVKIYDVNIPIYIQILDQANIKLYDMIKKVDGELIGRKVDCAIIANPKNKLECGDKWGDYRISPLPKLEHKDINNNITYKDEKQFIEYYDINDSNQYNKILNVALKGGCLITGNAGTGKSYIIHKITEQLGKEKIVKTTPTNKSALNIKGMTIHKFLKLNKNGKIPRERMETIKKMNLELIIIDEISMINSYLWKRLFLLKEELKIKFILVGDDKQLPPIEDDGIERDFFNSSIVKYLSDYRKINLEVIKRYDEKLSEILKDVENIDLKLFKPRMETKINICYFNKTRKRINEYWNNKEKKENSILINADEEDDQTQDIYLYEGLPLIARKNISGGDFCINNEKFTLDFYDNEFIYLSSDRPDENGDIFKHKIDVKIEDIQKNFLLNYCSTTHKSQGETITENFTIYDFNFMCKKCKYTALSRGKKMEQIQVW